MIYKSFKSLMNGMLGLYGNNVQSMVIDLTKKLFTIIRKPGGVESMRIQPMDVIKHTGKFILLKYDYNGNEIWCPVFALEYKIAELKPILYTVQLEYIPPVAKFQLLSTILDFVGIMQTNQSNNAQTKVSSESPIPIDAESMYNILKNNGLNYSLTGFDITKIKEAHVISTKVIPEIIACDCKAHNRKGMRELLDKKGEDFEYRDELEKIISDYDKMIEQYSENSLEYHKKIRGYEKNLKLFDE